MQNKIKNQKENNLKDELNLFWAEIFCTKKYRKINKYEFTTIAEKNYVNMFMIELLGEWWDLDWSFKAKGRLGNDSTYYKWKKWNL